MAQYVSHYLVDWDHFCRMWAEEEHPRDALEGSEGRSTPDDTYSATFWLAEQFEGVLRSAPQADWLKPLESCVAACLHRGDYRELMDDFAYEDGGFTTTMSPATTAWIASQWSVVPLVEVGEQLQRILGEAEGSAVLRYVRERMDLIAAASATGRGYVTRVG